MWVWDFLHQQQNANLYLLTSKKYKAYLLSHIQNKDNEKEFGRRVTGRSSGNGAIRWKHHVLEKLTYLRRLKSKHFYRIGILAQTASSHLGVGMVLKMVNIAYKPLKETFLRLRVCAGQSTRSNTLRTIRAICHVIFVKRFMVNCYGNFILMTVFTRNPSFIWLYTFLFNGIKWCVRDILFKKIYLNKY